MKVLDHYGIDCTGKKSGSYRKKSCSRKTCSDDADQEECDRNRRHTRTVDMPSVVKEADIVVVAGRKSRSDRWKLSARRTDRD